MMKSAQFVGRLKLIAATVLVGCAVVQFFIDESLTNAICTLIATTVSWITIYYTFDARRFPRSPMSSLMILGFNVSAFSAALIIQTTDGRSLIYNLDAPLPTFLALTATQFLVIAVHWLYLHSQFLLGLRFLLSRRVFRPMTLLTPPSDIQLWLFGLVGCGATVFSAKSYVEAIEFGNVSEKFIVGYIPFAVAPFLIPLRAALLGGDGRSRGSTILLVGYAFLLIGVAMANNARATFASGFLTLALCVVMAVLSGSLAITRKTIVTGIVAGGLAVPLFSVLSDLSTAMVIARDLRSNVSSVELIEATLSNFQDNTLIEDRRRRDDTILGIDYNENYIRNPIFARFVYTKFTDVNMLNALSLSEGQAEEIRKSAVSRVLAMLPTPILNYFRIEVDKTDIGFSSGDIYSFIARGLELGSYTTGSEVPDGLTIFGHLFWPVLAFLVLIQFIVYDALSTFEASGRVRMSAVALLNIVPIFTVGVMQESVANQVTSIFRGIPQLILLYLLLAAGTMVIDRILSAGIVKRIARRQISHG